MKQQDYLEVSQASDLPALRTALIAFAHKLDFGLLTAVLIQQRGSGGVQMNTIRNTPAAYLTKATDEVIAQRDPVMQRMLVSTLPFVYDQATYVEAEAADLWDAQAPFGYRTGIAMAMRLPLGGAQFFIGVNRDRSLPSIDEAVVRLTAHLQLLAVHAQDAALRLFPPPSANPDPARPRLTPRELEILKWTTAGKSSWVVGEILGLSENTVNFHVKNLTRKLGVSSKHQASLLAIRLGLL